jgi:hypothetical protein
MVRGSGGRVVTRAVVMAAGRSASPEGVWAGGWNGDVDAPRPALHETLQSIAVEIAVDAIALVRSD